MLAGEQACSSKKARNSTRDDREEVLADERVFAGTNELELPLATGRNCESLQRCKKSADPSECPTRAKATSETQGLAACYLSRYCRALSCLGAFFLTNAAAAGLPLCFSAASQTCALDQACQPEPSLRPCAPERSRGVSMPERSWGPSSVKSCRPTTP